jgi:diguanylate cyclase (GGDEF)-like protein
VRGFDLGAIDYVTKPFEPAELRARVRSALRMKRSQDLLTKRAQVDALTGLHNRAYLDDRLASEIAQARRTARPLSLVMIDLDHFKSLNDGYGHPFGDLVLQRVGDLLSRSTRPRDSACRYGGEELTLILPETSLDDAHGVAERLRVQLHALGLAPRGKEVAITASFGVSELSSMANGGLDVAPRDLVAAADQALYAAKHGGRDQVRCHTLPSANVAA